MKSWPSLPIELAAMYIVTVTFEVKDTKTEDFHQAVLQQAENSLTKEKECHQFDVCIDPSNKRRIFLYEVYSSESDFQDHLKSEHFLNFDKLIKGWLISKNVQSWGKLTQL